MDVHIENQFSIDSWMIIFKQAQYTIEYLKNVRFYLCLFIFHKT
jgi:hypothetical protein